MSRRSDDDLAALLDELSGTLDQLRTELDDDRRRSGDRTDRDEDRRGDRRDESRDRSPRRSRERDRPSVPRPGRFLQFTEEYTIPALIAFLEANIKALELLRGLLRVLNGGGDVSERRVESVGRRTLGQVDDLLGDVQGALEGQPSNPEARDLLADARSLREDIDERIRSGDLRRDDEGERRRNDGDRSPAPDRGREERDEPVTIDVTDGEAGGDGSDRRGEETSDGPARRDEVDVDSELDSLRREVRGGDSDAAADDDGSAADNGDAAGSDDEDEDGDDDR